MGAGLGMAEQCAVRSCESAWECERAAHGGRGGDLLPVFRIR